MKRSKLKIPVLFYIFLMSGILSVFFFTCALANESEERKFRRQVTLQAILGKKVILNIDGGRQLLSLGEPALQGVRVLRIYSDYIDVEVDGQQRKLVLGSKDTVISPFKERQSVMVSIPRDTQGMYTTVGSINGLTVDFLVDTGATTISMNSAHAQRLGIDYRLQGKKTVIQTASGVTEGYLVNLEKAAVGEISLNNVAAVVIEGQFPQHVLLGMSFLGQVEIQRSAGLMRLKKSF